MMREQQFDLDSATALTQLGSDHMHRPGGFHRSNFLATVSTDVHYESLAYRTDASLELNPRHGVSGATIR